MWFTVAVKRVGRYLDYLWDGIKTRFRNFGTIGPFGFIKGFFQNFFESWALVRIDIRDGYI